MQQLFLDCSHGMSGDMTLASLAHLGVDLSPLPELLARAGVACRVDVWREERGGGPGCRVEVGWEADAQPLRHPADIAAIFAAVPVAERVRTRALAVLEALTRAEAEAHGIAPEKVHFHEVGAVDTLVDILGACWALEELGVERVTACALPWFSGGIVCAHGEIPLPAPATANLMRGLPVYPTDARSELVTPTGAALARVLVDEFVDGPQGRLLAMGTGYGSRPSPSGLRAWLVEAAAPRQADHALGGEEDVMQLECHLDHLTGEELGTALAELAALPAVLDVLWLPGTGKKNRPSGLLRVLCRPDDAEDAGAAVLRQTHTLGLRRQRLQRLVLPREATTCPCGGTELPAKRYTLEGRVYVRPEADAVARRAAALGLGAPALRFEKK